MPRLDSGPPGRRPANGRFTDHQRGAGNVSRRRLLRYGLSGAVLLAAAGATGLELVNRGVLPGKSLLNQFDGACSVPATIFTYHDKPGPQYDGTFYSAARRSTVGYTIGYPPGHGPGDKLPLIIMLHGFGGDHANALSGLTPARALALKVDGVPLGPMALVTVDGGGSYWNPHPGDDPQAMLVHELIPMCQRRGLGVAGAASGSPGRPGSGRDSRRIGVLGISMGGYGALLLAEKYPQLIGAVAAISPAIWTSYAQANAANAGAYASQATFAANDAVTHTASLAAVPVRVAAGYADPFYPGVQAFTRALPKITGGQPPILVFTNGCHEGNFFNSQEPESLAFLAAQLT